MDDGDKMNKLNVLVKGPVLTQSGYGEHARLVVESLLSKPDEFEVFVMPINWGQTSWLFEGHPEQQKYIDLINKTNNFVQAGNRFDASLQVTIPNEFENLAPVNIGVTAGIETNKVAPVWIDKSNYMDKLITISEYAKLGFSAVYDARDQNGNTYQLKLARPIEVIGYPVRTDVVPDEKILNIDFGTRFNFLAVSQWGPRKNLANTIGWFLEEFHDNPDVGLVLKTSVKNNSTVDRFEVEKMLNSILSNFKERKCKVHLLHGDMSEVEMRALFVHPQVKAYVSLSHAEGYGLGIFEAVYCGLPVIAPEYSGYLDFMYLVDGKKKKSAFSRVDYRIDQIQREAIWPGVLEQGTLWAFPQKNSYKSRLQEVYKDHGRFVSQAKKLSEQVCEKFTKENVYGAYCDSVLTTVRKTQNSEIVVF